MLCSEEVRDSESRNLVNGDSDSREIVEGPETLPVAYPILYKMRLEQSKHEDLSSLTDCQWGRVELDKCHHISITVPIKDGPPSYRVRICKTCCQTDCHIELGTYIDQESAILVNDCHEILNDRIDKLLVLRPEDKPYLHLLYARKFDRFRGKDLSNILKILDERQSGDDRKRRRRSYSDCSHGISSDDTNGDFPTDLDQSTINVESSPVHFREKVSQNRIESPTTVKFQTPFEVQTSRNEPLQHTPSHLKIELKLESLDISTLSEICSLRSPLRPRAATIADLSTANTGNDEFPRLKRPRSDELSPMATLAMLASLEDADFNAAKTLSELFALKRVKSNENLNDSSSSASETTEPTDNSQFSNEGNHNQSVNSYSNDRMTDSDSNDNKDIRKTTVRSRSYSMPSLIDDSKSLPGGRTRAESSLQELRGLGFIGIYSPEERKKRIQRFLEKRKLRVWTKQVKYDVRKNFADSRIRVKGRFVRKQDEDSLRESPLTLPHKAPLASMSLPVSGSMSSATSAKKSVRQFNSSSSSLDHSHNNSTITTITTTTTRVTSSGRISGRSRVLRADYDFDYE